MTPLALLITGTSLGAAIGLLAYLALTAPFDPAEQQVVSSPKVKSAQVGA